MSPTDERPSASIAEEASTGVHHFTELDDAERLIAHHADSYDSSQAGHPVKPGRPWRRLAGATSVEKS